ncbi:GPI ethanolamine phosphate transferase 2 isoform X3 [Rhodamnia argentea]|uniref:GPI ethanolamine phosphate transferase 2 isoform X3 n=1 Tax=Rhodamnia argentea TaxID=178133 RepID=A0ABM3GVT2_9MYRT|nr:GPI ethanolamine phosphate transferase 2 isoform X3 [Rhodamnia argentea]
MSPSSSITCSRFATIAVAAVLLQSLGLFLFIFGFFPIKPALSGVSGPESFRAPWPDGIENDSVTALPPEKLKQLYQELSEISPPFDRLILMVIDGLPAEFVLGRDDKPPKDVFVEAMPYTQSLLANGFAVGYHAKAAPPTVTMPRLKAMVSGAIGGFLDVAFNFNTQALQDDNIIGQFFRTGRRMVMHGDDTWLKLFPGSFIRHDGVGSFFVKDTVQVDQNVSRHLDKELCRDDWDLLILHYLGLDHVGHLGGRNSFLMGPKLKEMDKVIEMIHRSSLRDKKNHQKGTLLVIVSDHGMTESGNHGGSSFEETDSLAVFFGLGGHTLDYASATDNSANQIDIAATVALLFNVPIPKNNIGVVIPHALNFMTDADKMRALELNSWQLLRLLHAQLSGLPCEHELVEDFTGDRKSVVSECSGNIEQVFCCLYQNAAILHKSWKFKRISMSNIEDYNNAATAYYAFLRTASQWLARRMTDKPVSLLVVGISAMLLSCLIFLGLVFHMNKALYLREDHHLSSSKKYAFSWHLDEIFLVGATLIHVISMGSSSMVEEEQYIWHFVSSTFYLLLIRKTAQTIPTDRTQSSLFLPMSQNRKINYPIISIFSVLVSGRILRAWHQGGINWANLPDISKWLKLAGHEYVKQLRLLACLLVIILSIYVLSFLWTRRKMVLVVGFSFFIPGLMVLKYIMSHEDDTSGSFTYNYSSTISAQKIYGVLGALTVVAVASVPWLIHISTSKACSNGDICLSTSVYHDVLNLSLLKEMRDSFYVIGWAYIFCWCLLQLLLQQPTNSLPVFLLLVQIYASMLHSFSAVPAHKHWIEVAAFYQLGMAGHFALGNSNSLATIDVAGAFIVIGRALQISLCYHLAS